MSAPDSPRPTGPIPSILRRIRRGSRDVIESAVSQLFDAAVQPHGVAASGEYRIDDLARLAGTTTRNIRVYRDRGLLHPPLRVGRIALFNDTHLTRLRMITSLLDRGYNIAHVNEMLSAWEQGKDVGDMLGLESAIAGTWAAEKPERMSVAEARRLVDDDAGFDRMVGLGVIKLEEDGQKLEAQLLGVDLRPDLKATVTANKKLMITWKNTNPLKFGLQQSDDLIQWENVDEELPSDQSTPVIELPLNKAVLFFRLIRSVP